MAAKVHPNHQQAVEQYAQGVPVRQISTNLKMGTHAVLRAVKCSDVPLRRAVTLKEMVISLHDTGKTRKEIAQILGRSLKSISRTFQEYGL